MTECPGAHRVGMAVAGRIAVSLRGVGQMLAMGHYTIREPVSPIRAVCQQIKRCCSQFSLLSLSWAAQVFFTGHIRSLHFVRVIRPASRRSDPFSHPSGSSARAAAFPVFSLKAVFLFPFFFVSLRPTRCSESRKRSVPGRVHSVFKNSGSWAARASPVQHLVDSRRGRIASKVIFQPFLQCWSGRAGASNQSWRA